MVKKTTKKTRKQKSPKDFVEVYELLESIRSRAGTEQFNFLHFASASIQLFIRTAVVLNGGSIILLIAFMGTKFAERIFDYGTTWILFFVAFPSILFFLGIISAVLSFRLSYLNSLYCAEGISYLWDREIGPVKEKYPEVKYNSALIYEKGEIKNVSDVISLLEGVANTAKRGLRYAYLSYAFLTIGYIVVIATLLIFVTCIR